MAVVGRTPWDRSHRRVTESVLCLTMMALATLENTAENWSESRGTSECDSKWAGDAGSVNDSSGGRESEILSQLLKITALQSPPSWLIFKNQFIAGW